MMLTLPGYLDSYRAAQHQLKSMGSKLVEIDYSPFLAAAKLLYEGAFVS